MKIAIDVSSAVYGTGVSNYFKNLVINLLKIDRQNDYILFATSLRQNKKLKEFLTQFENFKNVNIKVLHFPPSLFEFIWNRLHIYPIEKILGEVDVFHSWDWYQPPRSSNKTKFVTTVHDMVVYLFPSTVHKKIIASQKRRLSNVKKETDLIIADSFTTKDDLAKFLQIDPNKIRVVYLAPSSEFKPQDDEKIKAVLEKYKINKPYILSVSTQEPRKNIQKLIEAFSQISQNYPDFSLILTGKYGWGTKINYKSGREGKIIWTDYVPEEDLIALYSGCRVFVYPSLYEGFGLPVLEAMACGAPVITSNNSSLIEIAKDAAILVDPRSVKQLVKAIEFVINLNMDSYQKMAAEGIKRAKQFSWEKTARETLKVYEEITK